MVSHRWHRFFFYGIGVGCTFLALSPLTADAAVAEENKTLGVVEQPALPKHELYFSPEDAVDSKLISLIENEKEDIHAAIYCLTHRGIIKALIDARKRGVNIEIIVDPFTIKARAPLKRIAQSGISLFIWDPKPPTHPLDKVKPRTPLMHNKFCVFGRTTVWTGSFNFTSEASHANQENVVVIHDLVAGERYLEEFKRVKAEGCSSYRIYLANQTSKKNP